MADPKTIQLSGLDLILLENLRLLEENSFLRESLVNYKVMEKKMGLQKHLVEKYGIDLSKIDFSIDVKTETLTLLNKEENAKAPM